MNKIKIHNVTIGHQTALTMHITKNTKKNIKRHLLIMINNIYAATKIDEAEKTKANVLFHDFFTGIKLDAISDLHVSCIQPNKMFIH